MADKVFDSEQILNELNLDNTAEMIKIIDDLTAFAQQYVINVIDLGATEAQLLAMNEQLYRRAIISIVTQLYFDRTISTGWSPAVTILLQTLQAQWQSKGA